MGEYQSKKIEEMEGLALAFMWGFFFFFGQGFKNFAFFLLPSLQNCQHFSLLLSSAVVMTDILVLLMICRTYSHPILFDS